MVSLMQTVGVSFRVLLSLDGIRAVLCGMDVVYAFLHNPADSADSIQNPSYGQRGNGIRGSGAI